MTWIGAAMNGNVSRAGNILRTARQPVHGRIQPPSWQMAVATLGLVFYTYQATLRGLLTAGDRATQTARSPGGGGLPFILLVKIKEEELNGMMSTSLDLRGSG